MFVPTMKHPATPSAGQQALDLCQPGRRPRDPGVARGYLDLLAEGDSVSPSLGQRLMETRLLPRIYQRLWRPVAGRVLMGLGGPGTEEEHRIALEMLSIAPADRVLDLACGPGNFTRDFAEVADRGLVVGVDASETMLDVAVRDARSANVAYVRADARELPFLDNSFDAVCCFAALYLIEEPTRALREIARVLAPGGRVALLSSCNRGPVPTPIANTVVRGISGVRVFGRDELTRVLADQGLVEIEQRVIGLAQLVSARRPLKPGRVP
ncbi:MAG: class I SAM-dependent methyltransferase [Solirubrobacterales bacterium]